MRIPRLLVLMSVGFGGAVRADAAAFEVTDMSMGTSVRANGNTLSDGVFFPTNPLDATHHAQSGITEATMVNDVAWNESGGRFDFLMEHVVEDGEGATYSSSGGVLIFETENDLILEYDFSYSYELFGPFFSLGQFDVVAGAADAPPMFLENYVESGGPASLDPPIYTFQTSGQMLLPADGRYRITFLVRLTGGENTGAIGTGSGWAHYSLTPAPEPTPLALIAVPAMALLRRRRSYCTSLARCKHWAS